MTDNELREKIAAARSIASRSGPLHSLWDVIADAEAILIGKPAIMTREQVEAEFKRL